MMRSEKYAEKLLKYLNENNIKVFKARYIAKKLGIPLHTVVEGIKVLKKRGLIEKIGYITWMLKN